MKKFVKEIANELKERTTLNSSMIVSSTSSSSTTAICQVSKGNRLSSKESALKVQPYDFSSPDHEMVMQYLEKARDFITNIEGYLGKADKT